MIRQKVKKDTYQLMRHFLLLLSRAKCLQSYLLVPNSLTTRIITQASESMPSMCIVNRAKEIGLIIYTTYDPQSNTIYLGKQRGHT